MEMKQI
jgi:hypothetical protein